MKKDIIPYAQSVLREEAEAIIRVSDRLSGAFTEALDLMLACKGRVVVTGVGKSGHIGRKFASTLASTGTPSFFVHPAECQHGDFGMIIEGDVMVIISQSGESAEVHGIIPYVKRFKIPVIAICNKPSSYLGKNAAVTLPLHVEKEICPLNLAPTTSAVVTLALSDAIAVSLMRIRGFTEKDFAIYHPGGSLGKQLATVEGIMRTGKALTLVSPDDTLASVLDRLVAERIGWALIVDGETKKLSGILVDGDVKRILIGAKAGENILEKKVSDVMTHDPKTITKDTLVAEALAIMEGRITMLVVVEDGRPVGIVHIHDILKSKAI
ncbi:MAG: KpsF/GutQ family sugar-phosphate isomerase [Spirochaetota bacterium]